MTTLPQQTNFSKVRENLLPLSILEESPRGQALNKPGHSLPPLSLSILTEALRKVGVRHPEAAEDINWIAENLERVPDPVRELMNYGSYTYFDDNGQTKMLVADNIQLLTVNREVGKA